MYVLDPRSSKEAFIRITEVEPGSELAQAVVRVERKSGASHDRLRQIASYLAIQLR
jgi:hypothetical protein